jgi:hypothetical protein
MSERHIVYRDRVQEYWMNDKDNKHDTALVIVGDHVEPPISAMDQVKVVTLKDGSESVKCYLVDVLEDLEKSSLLHWTFQSKDKEETVVVLTLRHH